MPLHCLVDAAIPKPVFSSTPARGVRGGLDEIGTLYQERYPDVRVDFSYKGSGYFLADIQASGTGRSLYAG